MAKSSALALGLAILGLGARAEPPTFSPLVQAGNRFAFRAWQERRSRPDGRGAFAPWALYSVAVASALDVTGAAREPFRALLDWDSRPVSLQAMSARRARLAEHEREGLRLSFLLVRPSSRPVHSSLFAADARDVLGEIPETWPSSAPGPERVLRMARAVGLSTRRRLRDFGRDARAPRAAPSSDAMWSAAALALDCALDLPSTVTIEDERTPAKRESFRRIGWLNVAGLVESAEDEAGRAFELSCGHGAFAFFMYAPRSGKLGDSELNAWSESRLQTWRGRLKPLKQSIRFPRPDYDSGTVDDTPTLRGLGWPADYGPVAFWQRTALTLAPSLSGKLPTPVPAPVLIKGPFLWVVLERETGLVLSMAVSP